MCFIVHSTQSIVDYCIRNVLFFLQILVYVKLWYIHSFFNDRITTFISFFTKAITLIINLQLAISMIYVIYTRYIRLYLI